jgi:hypothetical protein
MGLMRTVLLGVALVAGVALTQHVSFAQSERVHALINHFLSTAQRRDYAALARVTGQFKIEESQIKNENPRSMWPSLLAEFWKQKIQDLEHKELKPSSLPGTERQLFDEGDDEVIHEARELLELMPASAKWGITEIRPRPRRPLSSVYYLDVYVSVSYPSKNAAATIGGKVLKKTILACTVAEPLDYVIACDRFEKGDLYWPEGQ